MAGIHEAVDQALTENFEKERGEALENYVKGMCDVSDMLAEVMAYHKHALDMKGLSSIVVNDALIMVHNSIFNAIMAPSPTSVLMRMMSAAPDAD